jgi:hypothetical protein
MLITKVIPIDECRLLQQAIWYVSILWEGFN